ncbi:hypothetical protein HYU12_01740 [Candidatus Woesearchaeota archaeon]|nr:hypothetical protein [Candidatus Woesearchaeota archaeon]
MTKFRKICKKIGRITTNTTGHWTGARVSFIKDFHSINYALRNEEISTACVGNFTIDEGSGGMKMKTKEQVMSEIKTLAKTDRKLLNSKYLGKIGYSSLVNYAYKHFGSWNNAILASGEKPLYQKWNKERVTSEIKRLHKETGRVPNYGELRRKGEMALPMAAVIYWGCWTNAIRAAGLKPYRNDYWTKKSLVDELKLKFKEFGYVPSGKELKQKGRFDLVASGSKFFSGYNNYLRAAGFEPVLIPNIWTKESVKNELRSLAKELKRTPTERDVIALGRRTLISAAWRQFKGWNNAIEAAGLNANWNFVKDKTWKLWETFVLELCSSLFLDSETHKILPNKTMPDFYEYTTKTIIEVKINGGDTTIPATIRNYSPYCNRIEIWYLTGKPANISSSKVIFRGPEYVSDIIKEDKELMEQFASMSNHYANEREKN